MKKVIFIFSIFVLIAVGCAQKTTNNSDIEDTTTNEKEYFEESIVQKESDNPASVEGEDISEVEHFVKEIDWNNVKCKQYQEADGYTNIQECVFFNATLQQVYDVIKKIDPNLKARLPLDNIEYSSTINGCIDVNYKYKTEKDLYIELGYQGGVTYIEIIEKENETQSKITYSAD